MTWKSIKTVLTPEENKKKDRVIWLFASLMVCAVISLFAEGNLDAVDSLEVEAKKEGKVVYPPSQNLTQESGWRP